MSTFISGRAVTIADLERAAERCELVDGKLVNSSPGGFELGRVTSRLVYLLASCCHDHAVGVVLTCDPGFIWDEHNVRAPDVAVVGVDEAQAAPTRGFMPFAPRLVVEVVSPSDSWSDMQEKARQWLAHGARLVWVVDPRTTTVAVYAPSMPAIELSSVDHVDGGDALPGFRCLASDFFR